MTFSGHLSGTPADDFIQPSTNMAEVEDALWQRGSSDINFFLFYFNDVPRSGSTLDVKAKSLFSYSHEGANEFVYKTIAPEGKFDDKRERLMHRLGSSPHIVKEEEVTTGVS